VDNSYYYLQFLDQIIFKAQINKAIWAVDQGYHINVL
jgi:hypothetical protein